MLMLTNIKYFAYRFYSNFKLLLEFLCQLARALWELCIIHGCSFLETEIATNQVLENRWHHLSQSIFYNIKLDNSVRIYHKMSWNAEVVIHKVFISNVNSSKIGYATILWFGSQGLERLVLLKKMLMSTNVPFGTACCQFIVTTLFVTQFDKTSNPSDKLLGQPPGPTVSVTPDRDSTSQLM